MGETGSCRLRARKSNGQALTLIVPEAISAALGRRGHVPVLGMADGEPLKAALLVDLQAGWAALTPPRRKELLMTLAAAKRPETRQERLEAIVSVVAAER